MAEVGKVIDVQKDGRLTVKLPSNNKRIIHYIIKTEENDDDLLLEAEDQCGADVGDWVEVLFETTSLLKTPWMRCTVSVLMFLISVLITYSFTHNGLIIAIIGFHILGATYIAMKFNRESSEHDNREIPVAVRKINRL